MARGILKTAKQNPAAGAIRKMIDATDDEPVTVTTPQFERRPGDPKPMPPPADFTKLTSLTRAQLMTLGMRPWARKPLAGEDEDEATGLTLWLFPGEWYSAIPAGLPIVDIFFTEKVFEPGKTDDDIRFGMLGFGILADTAKDGGKF